MHAKNTLSATGDRRCLICHRSFQPKPKVKERQRVCSRPRCQHLRQRQNHQAWLKRNPVNYQDWYQDYGKAWRQSHPEYQRQHRQCAAKRDEKKEQLSSMATKRSRSREKKEPLTASFYLLQATALRLIPLAADEKKEPLTYPFSSP